MFATKILAISLLVLVGYFLAGSAGCPPNFTKHQNKCYSFVKDAVTWGDAQTICKTYGATLAEPKSKAVNDWIVNNLKSRQMTRAWIGGYDIFKEGKWRWEGSRNEISGFKDWRRGQPDNAGNKHDVHKAADGRKRYVYTRHSRPTGIKFSVT